MSNLDSFLYTTNDLAKRWRVHRASVPRIMARFGYSGIKFGTAKQAARRYTCTEVERVEQLVGISAASNSPIAPSAQGDSHPKQRTEHPHEANNGADLAH